MTDESPQEPPRGRRARGSVDPGPDYPGDLPRRAYPQPQYPDMVPGPRRQGTPAGGYPAPPGGRGRLAEDSARGQVAPPPPAPPGAAGPGRGAQANRAQGYGPRTPPGESSPGYDRAGASGGYGRTAVPGRRRAADPDEGRRSYPAAPPREAGRGPRNPGPDQGRGRGPGRGPDEAGRETGRRRHGDDSRPDYPGPLPKAGRGRRAGSGEEAGRPGDFYADRGSRPGRVVEGRVVGGTAAPVRGEYPGRGDFLVPGPDDAPGDGHSGGRGRGRGLFGRRSREADPEPDHDTGGPAAGSRDAGSRDARAAALAPPERAARGRRAAPAGPSGAPGVSVPPGQPAPRGGPVTRDGSVPRGRSVPGGPVPRGGPAPAGRSVPGGSSVPGPVARFRPAGRAGRPT